MLGVMISDLITGADVGRRQWNLFQMHFQLLMASQSVDGFDYLDLMTGPEPVHALAASEPGRRLAGRRATAGL